MDLNSQNSLMKLAIHRVLLYTKDDITRTLLQDVLGKVSEDEAIGSTTDENTTSNGIEVLDNRRSNTQV